MYFFAVIYSCYAHFRVLWNAFFCSQAKQCYRRSGLTKNYFISREVIFGRTLRSQRGLLRSDPAPLQNEAKLNTNWCLCVLCSLSSGWGWWWWRENEHVPMFKSVDSCVQWMRSSGDRESFEPQGPTTLFFAGLPPSWTAQSNSWTNTGMFNAPKIPKWWVVLMNWTWGVIKVPRTHCTATFCQKLSFPMA